MTTVNDGLSRDLNSLVKDRRKTGGQPLPTAAAKTSLPARNGVGDNASTPAQAAIDAQVAAEAPPTQLPELTELTEVSRVEVSFTVADGGTLYAPTQITMTDANGAIIIFNYATPTIE